MTVTKRQQLEWLANRCESWPGFNEREFRMCYMALGNPAQGYGYHTITREEWQQERDKMDNRKEYEDRAVMGNPKVAQAIIDAHNALKDLPHASVIMDAWTKGANEFMDSLASSKPAPDNSWHERGELPPVGYECEIKHKCWSEFKRVTVVAITKEYAIVEDDSVVAREQHYHLRDMTFRPIRTEREKAIDEMIGILKAKFDRSGIDGISVADIVDELYDAGYRKVNP